MIAYLELPLRGTHVETGHDVLIMAFIAGEPVRLIYMDEDGSLSLALLNEVTVNWRFDDRRRRWLDTDTGDVLGEDDGDSQD